MIDTCQLSINYSIIRFFLDLLSVFLSILHVQNINIFCVGSITVMSTVLAHLVFIHEFVNAHLIKFDSLWATTLLSSVLTSDNVYVVLDVTIITFNQRNNNC